MFNFLRTVFQSPSSPSYIDELDDSDAPPPIKKQIQEIWLTVQLKAVWKPMAFVYLYNVFQVSEVPHINGSLSHKSMLKLMSNFYISHE